MRDGQPAGSGGNQTCGGAGKKILRASDAWPHDRFAVIERAWSGSTCAIIAGGPSLTPAQVEACRGIRVIAVNDAYRLAPWADVLYFADARWWDWHKGQPDFMAFAGQKVTIENTGALVADADVFTLHNAGTEGLSDKPNAVCTGRNSGYQALNIAVLAGATRILLLGFDMKPSAAGRMHWFGEHPIKTPPSVFPTMLACFKTVAAPLTKLGVEVINCTPDSALTVFPRSDIEGVLRDPGTAVLSA